MDINNKIAIITGGASGMGAATAEHLASLGAKIAILDQNHTAAEQLAAKLDGISIACDVTSSDSVTAAVQQVKTTLGSPRILVNCAGVAPAQRIVGREGAAPLAAFSKVIEINLIGTFNVLRVVAEQMLADSACNEDNERGVIINTASVAAYEGQIGQAAYSASKGGICSLTLPAAREFAKFGVRVVTIAPGLIATPMLLNMPAEVQTSLAAQVPFPKRLGKPSEFAALVAHIVENALLNGCVIRMDGALRMG